MGGYETCKRIRVEPFVSDLLVVALTGWRRKRAKSRAAEAGLDAHITKPADRPYSVSSVSSERGGSASSAPQCAVGLTITRVAEPPAASTVDTDRRIGRRIVKQLPWPDRSLATFTWPPWSSVKRLTSARPSPTPPADA